MILCASRNHVTKPPLPTKPRALTHPHTSNISKGQVILPGSDRCATFTQVHKAQTGAKLPHSSATDDEYRVDVACCPFRYLPTCVNSRIWNLWGDVPGPVAQPGCVPPPSLPLCVLPSVQQSPAAHTCGSLVRRSGPTWGRRARSVLGTRD